MTEKQKYFIQTINAGMIFEAKDRKEMQYIVNKLLVGTEIKFKKLTDILK